MEISLVNSDSRAFKYKANNRKKNKLEFLWNKTNTRKSRSIYNAKNVPVLSFCLYHTTQPAAFLVRWLHYVGGLKHYMEITGPRATITRIRPIK
jgi:hypothetical protein